MARKKRVKPHHIGLAAGLAVGAGVLGATIAASPACDFETKGNTLYLKNDCVVTETFEVPDGHTLDGRNHSITAINPDSGQFEGAVIENQGEVAHVTNLTVATMLDGNSCQGGDARLRGIMFEGASGTITHNTINAVNKGKSGCQEGNGIEVRNAPFDGSHPATVNVEVAHNKVFNYQKTGIVANGDVDVNIHHNQVGESFTQENLAANSVQLGFGATGEVTQNQIDGNQWKGTSNFAATAVLVYLAGENTDVSLNNIRGNSDVGIYFFADNSTADNNKIFDNEADHENSDYDIGLGNWGTGNTTTNNKIRGFQVPTSGDVNGSNKVIGNPHLYE